MSTFVHERMGPEGRRAVRCGKTTMRDARGDRCAMRKARWPRARRGAARAGCNAAHEGPRALGDLAGSPDPHRTREACRIPPSNVRIGVPESDGQRPREPRGSGWRAHGAASSPFAGAGWPKTPTIRGPGESLWASLPTGAVAGRPALRGAAHAGRARRPPADAWRASLDRAKCGRARHEPCDELGQRGPPRDLVQTQAASRRGTT